MAFLDIFKSKEKRATSLENPAVSLSSPAAIFSWLTGTEPTAAGEDVNHHSAMQHISVYACVRVIAESCASLPFKLYELTSNGRVEAFNNPLHDILMYEPNPEMSGFTFWETLVGCLALTGNCYAQIIWGNGGQVSALYPLHPLKTEPYRTPNGVLAYRTTDGEKNGVWRHIDAADIIAVPLFSYDGLKGLSPIMQARQSIGLAKASEKFGARFFGNGARPGGVMSTNSEVDEKTQQNMRESWERAQGGSNQGKTAFLFGDWKYEKIGLSPEESQFLATRKYQREDIAALFRISPIMIGDTTRQSNVNAEQQNLTFLTDTIRPYLSRIEIELKRKLFPNNNRYLIQADVTERLRGDFTTMQKGFQTGVLSGWLSRNDVRRELGENPGPAHLDVYMVPVNMQNSERLLDTESMQDQPIGGPKPTVISPTPQERNALKQYRTAYIRMFRDAVGRICKRDADKRDAQSISTVFSPLLQSISDAAGANAGQIMGLDEWNSDANKAISAHIKALAERCKGWKNDDLEAIAGLELTKAVRAMTYAAHRAAGEHVAGVLLEESIDE
jgi:HK97 family phage portal protein